ncbi:hypothetical protein CHO22_003605 [Escherichia coli]|nr:hypothetical protein [Escherichia coli]
MKLIDLLVQELPKRGGWPDGAIYICTEKDGTPRIVGSGWHDNKSLSSFKVNDDKSIIDFDQYESALAASQKQTWNGEGLPPVGCECEYLDNNGKWYPVTIKYASNQLVVISGITKILGVEQGTEIAKDIIIDKPQFRPLRTESERRHEAVLESICAVLEMADQDYKRRDEAKLIYEAIAAGKIPGVKLDD